MMSLSYWKHVGDDDDDMDDGSVKKLKLFKTVLVPRTLRSFNFDGENSSFCLVESEEELKQLFCLQTFLVVRNPWPDSGPLG